MSRSASAVTVSVAGELDIATESSLVDRVGAVIVAGPAGEPVPELVLDLAELRFCDSAGINALIRLRKLADQDGWGFALVRPQPPVRRVLDLTGLLTFLNVDQERPA